MKPTFEFMAATDDPGKKSGMAVWRYTEQRFGEDVECIVRQHFSTFSAALEMNALISTAFVAGEAQGYAHCTRNVLSALKIA